MSFKKAPTPFEIEIFETQEFWEWNQSGEFVKTTKNYQEEINEFVGQDLKSLFHKNIMPLNDRQPIYVDTTTFKDMDLSKLYNVATTELVQVKEDGSKSNIDSDKSNVDTIENNTPNSNKDNG